MRPKKAPKIAFKSPDDMPTMICSVGHQTHNLTGAWRNIRPEVDRAKCLKCGMCWKFCPEPAIEVIDEWPVVDYDYCKGCGICAVECPSKCIVMVEERR